MKINTKIVFLDESLFIPVLKVAEPFFMKRFLQSLNITTASRIVFFDKWQQWKIDVGSNFSFKTSLDEFSLQHSSTPTTRHSSPLSSNFSVSKKLMDILNCSDGETIKSFYQNNKNIDNKSVRSLLLNTIVNYSTTNNINFSSRDLMQLAEEIHITFNEDPVRNLYMSLRNLCFYLLHFT